MKIEIDNFQSLGHAEIEASGLTVVVGRSNVGKSALVRALTGATFNRAGDGFVRTGTHSAQVQIEGLPSAIGPPLMVGWEKGRGVNRFFIGDETYEKVGTSAPPPLESAGYRDVTVGSESIRPQVAGQFEGPFLLDKPGAFVSDTLSIVSRLNYLLRADRTCGLDLKRQKALMTVRANDLALEETKLIALAPMTALAARVAALEPEVAEVHALRARIAAIRALQQQRARLLPLVGLKLPQVTTLPELGTVQTARALVGSRQRLLTVRARTLPVAVDYQLAALDEWTERTRQLGRLHLMQANAVNGVFRAKAVDKSAAQQIVEAEAEWTTLKASIKACPLCERPWEDSHATF